MSGRLPSELGRASLLFGALMALAACAADDHTAVATSPRAASALASKGSSSQPTPAPTPTAAAAPMVSAVALAPSTVAGGGTAAGTVTLTAPAPAGGTFVGISSNNTVVATVSGSITIPAGATTGTFTVTSHPVSTTDFAAISATANQGTQTAVLTVTPSDVAAASLTISPTLVSSGATATGTVTLNGPAPAAGAVVALASNAPASASVPASVAIPAGATSGSFAIHTGPVTTAQRVTVTAAYGGVTQFAALIVDVPAPTGRQVTNLTIAPVIVVGGTSAQGTVTLASATGGATTVALTTTAPTVANVPATVTVPAGVASATFTITTSPTVESNFAEISASANGTTRFATVTTTAPPTGPFIASIVFFPSSVGGGGPATGRITMRGPATQGAQVTLSSSRPDLVQVPAVVVVNANATVADFPVTTSRVGANTTVSVTGVACCGGQGSATGAITVTTAPPPPPDVVRVESARFQPGGRGGTLTVRATSTSATAILTVFRDASTVPTFVLTNQGGGRYEGSFSFSGSKPGTVTVRSNLGGSATANVK
jgi:hypothetical protein